MSTGTGRTLSAVAVLTLLVSGCTSSEPQTMSQSQGVVSMTLKASGAIPSGAPSPAPGLAADMGSGPAAVAIVVAGVSARTTDGTWIPLAGSYPQTVDLLALVHGGGGATLPADGLPEGSYDALQITISSASITLQDGTIIAITPPGAGWQVLIPVAFEVVAGQETKITLDLKCDASFHFANGQFRFDPDIEVDDVQSGRH